MPSSHKEPLAIIGAACRLPGKVSDLSSLWTLLEQEVDAVTELPLGRFSLDRFFSAADDLPGHSYTRAAGIVDALQHYDASFFGLSAREAADMDPQQRLMLETTWEAMESAGIPPSSLRGSNMGVYIGASTVDYSTKGLDDPEGITTYSTIGASLAVIANRISYLFDLHGPSMVLETACSSALVALHSACQALWSGSIPSAVVGAVNILFSPMPFACLSKAHMISPDGRCKMFDASAKGYVRSEGGGAIIVKPLSEARRDNDRVLAVIAGTGVNSDGRTNGLPLPNPKAQAALLRRVYEEHRLDIGKLAYVEAHGTGTPAGDPIEASALGEALGSALKGKRRLFVGSVKTNIGHLEPAAGMAGLLKAILVLQHGRIPANLHFETPNPAIDLEALNLAVPTRMRPLPLRGPDALVGVNSFGFGGTNAHVVLRRAPTVRKPAKTTVPTVVPPFFLSARSEHSLRAQALALSEDLRDADAAAIRDTAHTLALCRDHLRFRSIVVPGADEPLADTLWKMGSLGGGKNRTLVEAVAENGRGAFVFSGNGSQWLGMGKTLLKENRDFADGVESADACLRALRGSSLMDMLLAPEKHPEAVSHTEHSQPLLFALQVGLVRALRAKGIEPDATFGHSVGEVAAAWTAGALSLQDACTVVHYRSKLQERFRDAGQMAVANIAPEDAAELLAAYDGEVEISACNTAGSITLSGGAEAVRDCVQDWKRRGITAKLLDLPYPFHTRRMEALRAEFLASVRGIRALTPRANFYPAAQNPLEPWKADAAYWWRNIRQPVGFHQAAAAALDAGCRIFLEIGPRPVLNNYLQEIVRRKSVVAAVLPTLLPGTAELKNFEHAWQSAWQNGWKLATDRIFNGSFTRRLLPPYTWDRKKHWIENTSQCRKVLIPPREHPLLGWRMALMPAYENILNLADFPWLADHRAGDSVLLPAAAFVEIMLAAAERLYPEEGRELEQLTLHRPLRLAKDGAMHVRLLTDREDGSLRLEGRPYVSEEKWQLFAVCRAVPPRFSSPASALPDNPESFGRAVEARTLYEAASRHHLNYGPAFQTVDTAWVGDEAPELLTRLRPAREEAALGMHVPPTLLDGAFQTLLLLLGFTGRDNDGEVWLPAAFGRTMFHAPGTPAFAKARLGRAGRRSALADFLVMDATGKPLLSLKDCLFRRAAWLENDYDRASGYVMRYLPAPLQEKDAPLAINMEALRAAASAAVDSALPGYPDDADIPVGELVRFTALKYAHECLSAFVRDNGGQDSPASRPLALPDLMARGLVHREKQPWLAEILLRLEQAGLALREGEDWFLQAADDMPPADMLWRTIVSSFPGHLPEARLIARICAHSNELLAAPAAPEREDTLREMIVAYYTHSPALRPFLQGGMECARELMRQLPESRPPRLLLTSADNTALAELLLPVFAGSGALVEVLEQDAGQEQHLAASLAGKPEARPLHLDLGRDLPETGEQKDMILAAFSLHGLGNSGKVLANCHRLLTPGGILCLVEHEPNTFSDLTFAAPSGGRNKSGGAVPPSCLHTAGVWKEALAKAGFEDITEVAAPADAACPAFLLLARKNPVAAPFAASGAVAEHAAPAGNAARNAPADAAKTGDTAPTADNPSRRFLIVAREAASSSGRLGAALKAALVEAGQQAELVHQGPEASTVPGGTLGGAALDPLSPADWRALLAAHGEQSSDIVYLLGYSEADDVSGGSDGENGLDERILDCCTAAAAALATACETSRFEGRLWLLSGGALCAGQEDSFAPQPSQGALWGFGRVLINEMPRLRAMLVDAHPQPDAAKKLVKELLTPNAGERDGGEREIILGRSGRYAPRLVMEKKRTVAGKPENPALMLSSPGRLHNLYWQDTAVEKPGPGQVSIAMKALGLNFRDVMWSLGALHEDALDSGFAGPGFGLEGAGIIEAVGPGVSAFKPGDEVMAFLPSRFCAHAVTTSDLVMRKPGRMSFAEAATLPIAFHTALYCIKYLAAMRPGESILIHGAAGGVGLAAVQLAARFGLEVHATAGSEEKRDFLRKLGLVNVYSSRSLSFAPQIMEATNGRGLDAVLNSLAGEYMAAGVSVLRPFGRFLEIGKRDFFQDSALRLKAFAKNLSFFGVDLDQLFIHNPDLSRRIVAELSDLFEKDELRPLPHVSYARNQSRAAFQTMQASGHMGKLVISMDEAGDGVRQRELPPAELRLRRDASYLVSGGAAGFGLATAKRLAERGAGRLILVSRSGIKDEAGRQAVKDMQALGATVSVLKADVADAAGLETALQNALAEGPPLAGLVHSAAVIDDAMISDITPERFRRGMAAKARGAWNLHRATLGSKLDFFVLYSSATTAFGNPGSAAYVAANGLLESLAAARRHMGLAATVIGWGPIIDTGMLQRNAQARQMLTGVLGVKGLHSRDALDRLEYCLVHDIPASHFFSLNWDRPSPGLAASSSKRFEGLLAGKTAKSAEGLSPLETVRAAAPDEGRRILAGLLRGEIAEILCLPEERLPLDTPIADEGMDSLMAMELGMTIDQKFELDGYAFSLDDDISTNGLAELLYPVIMSKGAGHVLDGQQMVEALSRKHGVDLADTLKQDIGRSLGGAKR